LSLRCAVRVNDFGQYHFVKVFEKKILLMNRRPKYLDKHIHSSEKKKERKRGKEREIKGKKIGRV